MLKDEKVYHMNHEVFTYDGERLVSSVEIRQYVGCSPDRARQILRDAEPYARFSNVRLYRKSVAQRALVQVAPTAAGLVQGKYIWQKAGIHNETLIKMLPLLPKPTVERVASDGRVFRWWTRSDADEAVEKIIRIHKPRKVRSREERERDAEQSVYEQQRKTKETMGYA